MRDIENVIIVGSGPAGLTAAIYTSRALLKPLVILGTLPGGQLMTTTEVENFPGFPEGINGSDLIANMRKQAERFNTRFINGEVTKYDFSSKPYKVFIDNEEYLTHSIIIATGAQAQYLNLPSEKALIGKGVSGCATCDGFFFKGKKVVVVGGGDSAIEEATFLTRFASSVTIVHRRDQLRASKIMQNKAFENKKIDFLWNSIIIEVLGTDHVTGIKVQDTITKEIKDFACDGVFLAVGHKPATNNLHELLEIDEKGYIKVKNGTTKTNVEGVFSAGDVSDSYYKQAITAAGSGCRAAIDCERYLGEILG